MRTLKNKKSAASCFPVIDQGIRIRNNFGRWFLYKTSRYDRYEINDVSVEIIKLCNGIRTTEEVVSAARSQGISDIAAIREFVDYLLSENLLTMSFLPVAETKVPVYDDIGPSWVVLHITNRCNLLCRHCYVNAKQRSISELSFAEICDCISQLKDMGVIDIIFTGGEPFIRPDFLEILAFCKRAGISSEILTNGTFIDEEKAKEIKSVGVTQVLLSLDGSRPEIHEKLRRVDGCWDSAIRGIKNLKSAGVSVVANTVINKENRYDLKNMPPLLAKLGVDVWRLGTLFYVGRSKMGDSHIDIPIGEQIEILSELDEIYYNGNWPFNLTTTLDWESVATSEAEMADRKHICGMTMGKHWYIRANGNVLVCDRLPELVIGNVRKKKLKELWGDELVKQWKYKEVDEIEGCQDCKWRYLCGGGCRANAKLHSGEFFQSDPVACLTMKCSVEQRWNSFPEKIRERLSRWISAASCKKGGEKICARAR